MANERNKYGKTPLINASTQGHLEVVRSLLNRGANVNAKDKNGCTSLMYAIEDEHTAIVRLLLNKGARANIRTQAGDTPLSMAVYYENLDIAKLLLDHGANVNARNLDGQSALMYAARRGNLQMVKLLLDYGANITGVLSKARNANTRKLIQNYYMRTAPKSVKKAANIWLHGPVVNVSLPNNKPADPISLKNFNKGNKAIMITKRRVHNGKIHATRYYMEKNTIERLTGRNLHSILRSKNSENLFRDPLNRRSVYRRNLSLIKFV
jgi:ankyrin repeat protein